MEPKTFTNHRPFTKSLEVIRDELAIMLGWTPPGTPLPFGPGTDYPDSTTGEKCVLPWWVRLENNRIVQLGPISGSGSEANPLVNPSLDELVSWFPDGWGWVLNRNYSTDPESGPYVALAGCLYGKNVGTRFDGGKGFVAETAVEAVTRLLHAILKKETPKDETLKETQHGI